MNPNDAFKFYQDCMNMNLSDMLTLIENTASTEEKKFYTELYNFVMRKRQKECIVNGVF